MLDLVVSMDFEQRLALALLRARNGDIRNGGPFAELLKQFNLVPTEYNRKGWLKFFGSYIAPGRGNDIERYGVPVLVRAMTALLQGDAGPAERVPQDMDAAIEVAKAARRRARTDRSVDGSTRREIHPSRSASISAESLREQISDALALLERAAATHNLLANHRLRVLSLAERLQQTAGMPGQRSSRSGPEGRLSRGTVGTGSSKDPKTDGSDATYGWGSSFRDHGQFGSHSAYDAMDDESKP